jgi:hypothetical protein
MVTPIANFVVSLGLDGRVVSQGTVSEALAKDHKLLQEVAEMNEVIEKAEGTVDAAEPEKEDKKAKAKAKLVVAEEIALGHVGWPALKLYVSSLGGFFFWAVFVGGLFCSEVIVTLSTWFLGEFTTCRGSLGS